MWMKIDKNREKNRKKSVDKPRDVSGEGRTAGSFEKLLRETVCKMFPPQGGT
jgi:hypothetical protein